MTDQKPKLVLLHGRMITALNIAMMFKALTGRDADLSPERLNETNRKLQEAYARLNESRQSATPRVQDGGEEKN